MLVSIITPSYNSKNYIMETYKSIHEQTHEDWEWLITDDCSSDGTWELLCELSESDSRIIPIQNQRNSGAAISRNNSMERAKGEFFAFLDSDDLWSASKLEKHLGFMEKNNIDLSFTPYTLISESGEPLNQIIDSTLIGGFSYEDMLCKKATMGCCTVIIRRSAFTDTLMPQVQAGQDYALWLKLLKTCNEALIYPEALSQYRIVSTSLSRNKFNKAKKIWYVYRHIEKLNLVKSCYVYLHYAIKALFKLNQRPL